MKLGSHWIAVEERLPERNVRVLTCLSDGVMETNFVLPVGKWYQRYGDREVTHWMPLPPRPLPKKGGAN